MTPFLKQFSSPVPLLTPLRSESTRCFSRRQIASQGWQLLHPPRNRTKAEVFRLEWPPQSGQFVVLKDISRQPLWLRLIYSRFILSREWRALQALQCLDVAPKPVERVDADAIVMSEIVGKPIHKYARDAETRRALAMAAQSLATIHAHGVTHGDLHRANLLIGDDGRARVVDWATGCVFRPGFFGNWGWKKRAKAEWQHLDWRAIAKLKRAHAPELLSEEELLLLESPTALHRVVRRIGNMARVGISFFRS